MNFNKYRKKKKLIDINFSLKRNNLKKLRKKIKKSTGRNFSGKITVRHIGGGVKKLYRVIDFKRNNSNSAIVKRIEYDPYRNCFIALILYSDNTLAYILSPSKMKINDKINSKEENIISYGDVKQLKDIPLNMNIFNIEKEKGHKSILCRSAGTYSIIIKKTKKYCILKLPSKKKIKINPECKATIGICSNQYFKFNKKWKAGTNRFLNRRPTVRGVAMNPIDHPHGGGEGKTSGGRPSVSIWGKLTKSKKKKKNEI